MEHNNPNTHYDRGVSLEEGGQFEEAAEEYRNAINESPSDSEPHFRLGNVLLDLDNYEEAMQEFREVVRLNPLDADAFYGLGVALEGMGLIERVISSPVKFKPLDLKEALSILMGRKEKEVTQLQKKVTAFYEDFKKSNHNVFFKHIH